MLTHQVKKISSHPLFHKSFLNRIEFETVLNTVHSLTTKERQEIFKKCRIAHGKYSFQGVYNNEISNNEISNNEISNNEIDDNENTNEMTQERQFIVHQETVVSNESEVKLNLDVKSFIPHKDSTYVSYGFHSQLKTILKSDKFFPTYITGISGIGKNKTIEQVCAELKRPLLIFPITELTTEEELFGSWTLVNGNTVFLPGPVLIAATYGMVLVLDEIDLASPKIMCLQGLLNGDNIFIRYLNRHLNPKKGFNIIATGNTKGYGESSVYVGTQSQNEAFLERFRIMFDHKFPSQTNYTKMIKQKLISLNLTDDKSSEFAEVLSTFVTHISTSFLSGSIEYYISNRRLMYILEVYELFDQNRIKALTMALSRFPSEITEAFISTYTKLDKDITIPIDEILKSIKSDDF